MRRTRRLLREAEKRYPGGMGTLSELAMGRGSELMGDWPQWCWLPREAAAVVVAGDAPTVPQDREEDVSRLAALATWRLTMGIYRLNDNRVLRDALAAVQEFGGPDPEQVPPPGPLVDQGRILAGMPQHCVYVAFPVPRWQIWGLPIGLSTLPLGLWIHLEHNYGSGRPELRLLADTDGSWEGLRSWWLPLDCPTFEAAAREAAPAIVPPGGRERVQPEMRAMLDQTNEDRVRKVHTVMRAAWPLVETITDPDIPISRVGRPGERPFPAQPTPRRGARIWKPARRAVPWLVDTESAESPVRTL